MLAGGFWSLAFPSDAQWLYHMILPELADKQESKRRHKGRNQKANTNLIIAKWMFLQVTCRQLKREEIFLFKHFNISHES